MLLADKLTAAPSPQNYYLESVFGGGSFRLDGLLPGKDIVSWGQSLAEPTAVAGECRL